MKTLTKLISPVCLLISAYAFTAQAQVSVNLETSAKSPCINGAAGPGVLVEDPVLKVRIEGAYDEHPENPLGEVLETEAKVKMDAHGEITATYQNSTIVLGTLNYDEFNQYCATQPKQKSILNRLPIRLAPNVRVLASRKVGECVRAGIFHPEQYRYVDFGISIQAGSQTMVLSPKIFNGRKFFMMFASKADCQQWHSTWSEVEAR